MATSSARQTTSAHVSTPLRSTQAPRRTVRRLAAGAAAALAAVALAQTAAPAPQARADIVDDVLRQADPGGGLSPYVREALAGAYGQPLNPGPPAPVGVDVPCRPTPAHPVPVVLVHGSFEGGPNVMATLGGPLRARGFCVVAPTVGAYAHHPGMGEMDSIAAASGPQLAGVIDQVKAATGAGQVDLVGYSQGAAVAGYTTKVLRPGSVRNVVSVAGYWGSDPAGLLPQQLPPQVAAAALYGANLRGLSELFPWTPTVTAWYGPDRTPYLPGVRYTLIASENDATLPPQRSFVPGPGVALQTLQAYCPGDAANHGGIVRDPATHGLVAAGLGDDRGVPCG